MKKIIYILLFTIGNILINAQPPCPTCPPGNGGVGGTTPGARSSPIDMYAVYLAAVAIILIMLYAKKVMRARKIS